MIFSYGGHMKAAIIGCKNISYSDLENNLPKSITEIMWSGENELLYKYARENNIKLTYAKPDYGNGNGAIFMRNIEVARNVDIVIAFWDGVDADAKAFIDYCSTVNKNTILIRFGGVGTFP